MVRGGPPITRHQITTTCQVDLDENLAAADSLASLEDTGHVAERVWQVIILTVYDSNPIKGGIVNHLCPS